MSLVPISKQDSNILVVDDNKMLNTFITKGLQDKGYKIENSFDAVDAKKKLTKLKPTVILLDLTLPPLQSVEEGLNLFRFILNYIDNAKVIILSGTGNTKTAVQCMHNGAYDYIEKTDNIDIAKIEFCVERALQLLEYEKIIKDQHNANIKRLGDLIGQSKKMQQVYKLIMQYADTNENIMLLGETGTGKNITARTIHDVSQRSNEQFLYLNCSTLTPNLLESELFGYEKGAFSGADKLKIGLFEAANKGTLFLDEITEIDYPMQAKLLDAIESKSIRRIGGIKNVKIDVRILSATNQDLEKLIGEKKFREDLFQRLNILSILLPPLREKKEDIKILGQYLFQQRNNGKCKWISEECFNLFNNYDFPGNIREYDNIIKELIAKTPAKHIINPTTLRPILKKRGKKFDDLVPFETNLKQITKQYEMEHIEKVIEYCNGKKGLTAKLLGISHQALNKKLRGYEEEVKKNS